MKHQVCVHPSSKKERERERGNHVQYLNVDEKNLQINSK